MKYFIMIIIGIGLFLVIDAYSQKSIVELQKLDDCIFEENKATNLPSRESYEVYADYCINKIK